MQHVPSRSHTIRNPRGAPHPLDRIVGRVVPRFTDLGGPGTVTSPLILVGVLSVVSAAGMHPMVGAAFAGQPSGVGAGLQSWLWLLAAASPLVALAKALILGGAAWAVLILVAEGAGFIAVASAVLYGEVILALQGVWIAAALQARGSGSLSEPSDLRVVTGLGELIGNPHPALLALAQGTSVFHLAWIVFLSLALASVGCTTRVRGFAAALMAWTLVTGMGVMRALLA